MKINIISLTAAQNGSVPCLFPSPGCDVCLLKSTAIMCIHEYILILGRFSAMTILCPKHAAWSRGLNTLHLMVTLGFIWWKRTLTLSSSTRAITSTRRTLGRFVYTHWIMGDKLHIIIPIQPSHRIVVVAVIHRPSTAASAIIFTQLSTTTDYTQF